MAQLVTALASLILGFTIMIAWITHVVACIKAGAWLLLLIGGIIAPIGVIHGFMIWFGVPWVH